MRLAARFMGIRGPLGKVPGALWRLLVLGASGVDRFSTVEEATPQALRLLGLHFRFDSSRARTELGWSPRPFEEVLRATIEHLSFLDAP